MPIYTLDSRSESFILDYPSPPVLLPFSKSRRSGFIIIANMKIRTEIGQSKTRIEDTTIYLNLLPNSCLYRPMNTVMTGNAMPKRYNASV